MSAPTNIQEFRRLALAGLTTRQRQVLALIGHGLSSAEIGRRLFRTPKTIESHRQILGRKLGARNRVELARIAIEAGLLNEPIPTTPDGPAEVPEELREQLTGLVSAQQILRNIDAGTGVAIGDDFFHALTSRFASSFMARCAFIGELRDDGMIRSISASRAEGMLPQFEYPFEGSPCATLRRDEIRSVTSNIEHLFSGSTLLAPLSPACLLVAPLFDAAGSRLGTMGMLLSRPPEPSLSADIILRIFAGRISAELSRRRAEHALRQSLRRYQIVLDNSPHLICEITPQDRIEWASPTWNSLLRTIQMQPGDSLPWMLVHPEDRALVRSALETSRRSQTATQVVHRLQVNGELYRWFETHFRPVTAPEDADGWNVAVSRDITAQRLADGRAERIRESADDPERVAAVGTVEICLNRPCPRFSPQAMRILGLNPSAAVPDYTTLLNRVDETYQDQTRALVADAVSKMTTVEITLSLLGFDNVRRHVRVHLHVAADESGKPGWVFGTIRDLGSH